MHVCYALCENLRKGPCSPDYPGVLFPHDEDRLRYLIAALNIAEKFLQNYVIRKYRDCFPESFFSDLQHEFQEQLKSHPACVPLGSISLCPTERDKIRQLFQHDYKTSISDKDMFQSPIPVWMCMHQVQIPRLLQFNELCKKGAEEGLMWPEYTAFALVAAAPLWIFGTTQQSAAEREFIGRALGEILDICRKTCDAYATRVESN